MTRVGSQRHRKKKMENMKLLNKKNLQFKRIHSYRKIQQDATVYQNLLFYIYMKLDMFRATHRPLSGA